MKRWLLYLAGLLVILLLPTGQGRDVGKLKPVEVLSIYMEEGRLAAATDTGDYGTGNNLARVIEDMKQSSSGEIFLETVSYVLVTEDTKEYLEELGHILRPGTAVVLATGEVDMEHVAEFLRVHKPQIQLRKCMVSQVEIPKLMKAGERNYLVQ